MAEEEPVITHVEDSTICANIKSKAKPHVRCPNPATHGEYCGIHYKLPRKWAPCTPKPKKKRQIIEEAQLIAGKKIMCWWRSFAPLYLYRTRGPAYYLRSISVNDIDFFSCDKIVDIPTAMFFSYRCDDNHVYSFDIRSIHSLIDNANKAERTPENPYNRVEIPLRAVRAVRKVVRLLRANHVSVEWAPLAPPTPEQRFRMKVVDAFQIINQLNYYSSPDWFINLDVRGHRRFYTELHDIWVHRAGLTLAQKNSIIPGFPSKVFRSAPWALRDIPLEAVAKLNLNTIRMFIESAEDNSDRILGAMYIVTALTLVSMEARNAYPWLYETVEPAAAAPFAVGYGGFGWLNELLHNNVLVIPPLQLPPPLPPQ